MLQLLELSFVWGRKSVFYGANVFQISIDDDDISTLVLPVDHGVRFKSRFIGWGAGGAIDRRIRHTLNSYANARKEPRRQYIHTQTLQASVYTLRSVFCIPSSELIQSRGPPGDFRCGEIVITTRYFIKLSHWEREIAASDDDGGEKRFARHVTGPELSESVHTLKSN